MPPIELWSNDSSNSNITDSFTDGGPLKQCPLFACDNSVIAFIFYLSFIVCFLAVCIDTCSRTVTYSSDEQSLPEENIQPQQEEPLVSFKYSKLTDI